MRLRSILLLPDKEGVMFEFSENFFFTEDDEGNAVRHDILFSFFCEDDGNTYVVHTLGETDENGNRLIYASYVNEEKYGAKLKNIENDSDFEAIAEILNKLIDRIRKEGETDESCVS